MSEINLPLLFMGDFNCPNIDWRRVSPTGCSPRERAFLDFVVFYGLEQKVPGINRSKSGNILDLVICSADFIVDDDVSAANSPVKTDHLAVLVTVDFRYSDSTNPIEA